MGTLYYGDNLDILRRYLKDETLDLVYLDPPFNSAQSYNALAGTRLTLSTRPSSYIPRFACRAARTIRRKATGRRNCSLTPRPPLG